MPVLPIRMARLTPPTSQDITMPGTTSLNKMALTREVVAKTASVTATNSTTSPLVAVVLTPRARTRTTTGCGSKVLGLIIANQVVVATRRAEDKDSIKEAVTKGVQTETIQITLQTLATETTAVAATRKSLAASVNNKTDKKVAAARMDLAWGHSASLANPSGQTAGMVK